MGIKSQQNIVCEIRTFDGMPAFRFNMNTNMKVYFKAYDIDLRELIWMMEEKDQDNIDNQDLQNIRKLVEKTECYLIS